MQAGLYSNLIEIGLGLHVYNNYISCISLRSGADLEGAGLAYVPPPPKLSTRRMPSRLEQKII